jgi:hypothetical protein
MSDQKVPTAPDYSPLVNAYNAIAQHATTQGNAAYDWAKGQVANNSNLIDQVNSGNLDTQSTFGQAAKDQLASGTAAQNDATGYLRNERDRYKDPSYVANDMGASEANVGQAFDAARNSSIQELESYGVNPSATRFAGLDAGVRTQRAAAQAAAGTTAARQDQQLADTTNDKLLNQGNTQVGQSTNLSATGTGAGQGAVGNRLSGTASGANVLGTDLAWTGANSNALGGAVGAQNTGFSNQAESDKISNSSSSGIGSLLGAGASMLGKGGAFASGGALAMFAEGGVIPDAADGGQIPMQASPSGGAVTDDVPAQAPGVPNIRLNGGEMIIPRDVSQWVGQKFFQDLINKTRKAMGPAVGDGQQSYSPPGGQPQGGQGPMERTAAVG